MSYTKHNFKSRDVLSASQLNEMDDQIAANETTAAGLSEDLSRINTILMPQKKTISNAFVSNNGVISEGANKYDLICFSVSEGETIDSISVDSGGIVMLFLRRSLKLVIHHIIIREWLTQASTALITSPFRRAANGSQ